MSEKSTRQRRKKPPLQELQERPGPQRSAGASTTPEPPRGREKLPLPASLDNPAEGLFATRPPEAQSLTRGRLPSRPRVLGTEGCLA